MKTDRTAEEVLKDVEAMKETFSNMERQARETRKDLKATGELDDFLYGRYTAEENCCRTAVEELNAILNRAAV